MITLITPAPILTLSSAGDTQKLLIVEDDLVFADVLNDYAIEKGFKPILAHSGDVALEMSYHKRNRDVQRSLIL